MSGVGMVSSLGLDVVSSCAAARAGLQRMVALDFQVLDADELEVEHVNGHQVPLIAASFFGYARLVELCVAALEDLRRAAPQLASQRLGVILIAGSPLYSDAARALEEAEAKRDPLELKGARALAEQEQRRIESQLLTGVLRRVSLLVDPRQAHLLRGSCTTLVDALQQAQDWLAADSCDCCIVGAVDSLVDVSALAPLNQLRILRSVALPVGLLPGEGACFLALERRNAARGRRLALLESFQRASGTSHPQLAPEATRRRETLPDVVLRAIEQLGGAAEPLLLPVNLNGDEHRAHVWGELLVRLKGALSSGSPGVVHTWWPCASFGDTGAAIGCMSIGWLTQAWTRGYAPASRAVTCLMDDVGGRAAIALREK